jgi:hypothetical protein
MHITEDSFNKLEVCHGRGFHFIDGWEAYLPPSCNDVSPGGRTGEFPLLLCLSIVKVCHTYVARKSS